MSGCVPASEVFLHNVRTRTVGEMGGKVSKVIKPIKFDDIRCCPPSPFFFFYFQFFTFPSAASASDKSRFFISFLETTRKKTDNSETRIW